jgi:hypothetical protein
MEEIPGRFTLSGSKLNYYVFIDPVGEEQTIFKPITSPKAKEGRYKIEISTIGFELVEVQSSLLEVNLLMKDNSYQYHSFVLDRCEDSLW